MTNRVNATMNGVQGASFEPRVEGAAADSAGEKLPARHDAMLPSRQLGEEAIDPLVARFTFATYFVVNADRALWPSVPATVTRRHLASVARASARMGAPGSNL
jgi:hypothetical protein